MNEVFIAAAIRTAVGKAPKGTLATTRPDDLAATAIQGALQRVPVLDAAEIEDVILGCAMPEAEQGTNVAPHCQPARGSAGRGLGDDHQPFLFVGPAGDRACCGFDPIRPGAGGAGGRN